MKAARRSKLIYMVLVALVFSMFSSVASAAPQTLTILGAQGYQGQTDAYTEYSRDGGQTWNKAYLSGWHPWGFVEGTDSWLNCGPSGFECLYEEVLYRVRFNVPEGFTNPQMTFEVKADNYATIWLNGTHVTDIVGANRTESDAVINSALVTGMNEIRLSVRDEGGWAGLNYKITIHMDAPTPPVIIDDTDKIAPTATVSYSNTAPTNQGVVATITPSEPVTITNNGGSPSYTFTENGSFTFEFVDAAGNVGSAVATVSNIDKTAPTLTVRANTNTLFPPNHKLVDIRFSWNAQDNGAGIAGVKLISVTSNEPDNGLGDGDVAGDIQGADLGTADEVIQLRAERSGKGTGRVYTITYEATDLAGNSVTASTTVTVPHSAKK